MNTTETKNTVIGTIQNTVTFVTVLTLDALANILFGVKGVTFIGADTTTIPDMNKVGNPFFGNVVKDSSVCCMLGFDYETRRDTLASKQWLDDAIDAARSAGIADDVIKQSMESLKEFSEQSIEKFESKPRKWGKHMINPHTGKVSRIMVHHTKKDQNGQEIPESYKRYMQVEILTAKTPVYRYADTGNILNDADLTVLKQYIKSKTDEPIIIRDYAIENINRIRINKREYIIKK